MEQLPENTVLIHIGNITFFAITSMAVIGILVASLFLAANIRFREYKLLKMTSPNLNLVMLSGAILSCVTVGLFGSPAWLSDNPSPEAMNAVCMLRHAGLWLGSVSFTLFFAPTAAKTWRVHRIFSDAAVKGRVIKDDKLLCFVALFVVVDVGFLSVWFGVDAPRCKAVPTSTVPGFMSYAPLSAETDDASSLSSVAEYQLTCVSKLAPMWMVILCLYKGILLYYIIYVAWATRYVTFPSMKDAGGLIIGIFTTLSCFCIGAPLVATLDRWPNVQYIIFSLAIFVPLITVMLLHFLPKLILIRRHNRNDILTRSFSKYATRKQHDYSEEEIRDLKIQNASLRKEVNEKQRRYKAVTEQLRLTKAKLFKLSMITTEMGEVNVCGSDDNLHSEYTDSTGDFPTGYKRKRKESLAQRVTRALTLKSHGPPKSDDASVESSSTSQHVCDETTQSESTHDSTNTQSTTNTRSSTNTQSSTDTQSSENASKQTDIETADGTEKDKDTGKYTRHVSFGRTPSLKYTADHPRPQKQLTVQTHNPVGAMYHKPVMPIMGRNSWDYYTRGTGYLRYKTTVLKQGNGEILAAVTGYPLSETRQPNNPNIIQLQPMKSREPNAEKLPSNTKANKSKSKSKGDFRYFSTSASSRPPSSSTDINSSLSRSNDENVSPNQTTSRDQNTIAVNPLNARLSNNNNNKDSPDTTVSAFSVVSKTGRRPTTSEIDNRFSTRIGFQRVDDIGITYEDDYSTGTDSDEYNTTTSMDSITCELFPPLTPRHRHYLRRYDAMQARYLANKRKSHQNARPQTSEKSEGYCSGNEASNEGPVKTAGDRKKSGQHSSAQGNAGKDYKRKLWTRVSRNFDDAYLCDSTTSSDTDSGSDWENSVALKQCWARAAQSAQIPLLKPGPITYSHTRKDGIFV